MRPSKKERRRQFRLYANFLHFLDVLGPALATLTGDGLDKHSATEWRKDARIALLARSDQAFRLANRLHSACMERGIHLRVPRSIGKEGAMPYLAINKDDVLVYWNKGRVVGYASYNSVEINQPRVAVRMLERFVEICDWLSARLAGLERLTARLEREQAAEVQRLRVEAAAARLLDSDAIQKG